MKSKIYENREGLQGRKFMVNLNGSRYEFRIMYVDRKEITVYTSVKFSDMASAPSGSVEGIIRNIILENTPDNNLPLSRRAFRASGKLKKIPVIIRGIRFRFDLFTSSNVRLVKSMDYDELFDSQKGSFAGKVNDFVLNNLSDNPPKPKKYLDNGRSFSAPYLFNSGGDGMYFRKLGPRRTVVSEAQLEKNRQRNKEISKEEKKKREKIEKLESELGLNKKSHTRELARYR